ncbi:MAG TPA: hypothetical protein VN894_16755 [Polyangiaceae bacterium]|nr:hypothetical protein [Polyangiaceae bacterium]
MVSRDALEGLRSKYREILALRLAGDPGDEGDATMRKRMAELASRFPGALRELDDLELGEIRGRTAALDAVLREGTGIEPWMEASILFHALARGALCAKRWLVGRKRVDAEVERAYAASATGLAFPDEARAWASDLASIASPPQGRVTQAVFSRVAHLLGTTDREAKRLVFGSRRRGLRGTASAAVIPSRR